MSQSGSRQHKILIIRNSALGDVAMTLPVIYSAARQYPESEFYLLTRPLFAKIFINRPANLHIITADFKAEYKGLKGIWRLLRKLSTYRFTAVADLHNVLRSWVIDMYMRLRGKRVCMVDKKRAKRITTSTRSEQTSFIKRYADVFSRLGFPVTPEFVSLFEALGQQDAQITKPAVGIAPFARYANKTYPVEKMEQVVEMLTKDGYNVYLYGAKGSEAETLDAWAAKYERCMSLARKMDITAELASMSKLDVMVSMDSANQHLASLVNVPVVSIWGSTTPGCGFYGYRQSPDNAVCLYHDCQPCTVAGSPDCAKGNFACLNGITPEMIVDKVKRLTPNP